MSRAAVLLGLFAVIGVGLVAMTHEVTHQRIAANERAALLQQLHAVVPDDWYDNELFDDMIQVRAPEWLGSSAPVDVYRARMSGRPVAAVLTPVAPNGYNGSIRLLVGISYDGSLSGVRVIAHRETPGLGDGIDESRSDWITQFAGRTLGDPGPEGWKVKRDGGVFDQFTGATITPRAVVKAIHRCLQFYMENRDALFAASKSAEASPMTNRITPKTQPFLSD